MYATLPKSLTMELAVACKVNANQEEVENIKDQTLKQIENLKKAKGKGRGRGRFAAKSQPPRRNSRSRNPRPGGRARLAR